MSGEPASPILDTLTGALSRANKARRSAAFRLRRAVGGAQRRLVFLEQGRGQSNQDVCRELLLTSLLGEGGYSTVWRVQELQPDGRQSTLVVKRVVLMSGDAEQESEVMSEVDVMRALPPHPNILALIGYCRRARARTATHCAREEVFLLLEHCRGGSLAELLQRKVA